jgi:zinc D-Ala-D-Ala dipeptidase
LMTDQRVFAVPVHESGETLVDVRESEKLLVSDFRADGFGAFTRVRAGVFNRLLRADAALPTGIRLLFIEGYRPPRLQRHYFEQYLGELHEAHPQWSEQQLVTAASRYVSPPDLAPHSAGAAVDVTLCTAEGDELDLGTAVNASPEASNGACYTAHPGLDRPARRNRAILGEALGGAGLVNYPTEWWHWSYGDRYWAFATDAVAALYGMCADA